MGAAVTFWAGLGSGEALHHDLTASGIGFYGAAFGNSVQVGQYQDTSFITNSNGTEQAQQADNCKYLGNVTGVEINGFSPLNGHISGLARQSGTVNVRFTNDAVVNTQNGEIRIFDRTDIDKAASGVTTQVAQLLSGGDNDRVPSGVEPTTGDAQAWNIAEDGWLTLAGNSVTGVLLNNPGSGGYGSSGVAGIGDTRHDWYLAISATPTSIGSKTLYGLFIQLEFL